MRRDPRAFLWGARNAADLIVEFVQGLDFEAFRKSAVVQAAVERKFQIIGEALNQLSRLSQDIAARIPELHEIVAFRNVLVHGYAAIDEARVWRISSESLPSLRAAVAEILDDLG